MYQFKTYSSHGNEARLRFANSQQSRSRQLAEASHRERPSYVLSAGRWGRCPAGLVEGKEGAGDATSPDHLLPPANAQLDWSIDNRI